MNRKYQSELLGAIHETAAGLHKIGVITDVELREYGLPAPRAHEKHGSGYDHATRRLQRKREPDHCEGRFGDGVL
ncbi:MAG: hypothetical protein LBT13_00605 [Treponema sp.]|jgi:hypothetical protein|nr:hypothetical protein [Treponema sp.]